MSDTSEDLLADRRFAWAKAMASEGDHAAAADLLDQVVERVPRWAPAWAALAEARTQLCEPDAAMAAWRRAAALDGDGRLGAALQVARLDGRTPDSMAQAYVRALFDAYAPRFEQHLVEALHYRAPELLIEALERVAAGRRFTRGLDLGCGTGLMGRVLASRVQSLDGVDLSSLMIEAARRAGLYATLDVASLDECLAESLEGAYNLVTAADVLVYVGDLAPVMRGACRVLVPGGILAFTLQGFAAESGGFPYILGGDLRFAHAPGYVEAVLKNADFEVLELGVGSSRTEKGQAVPGLIVVGRRA